VFGGELCENDGHAVSIKSRLKAIFTALGESASERFLAQRIYDYLGARAVAAEYGQMWEITKESVKKV